MVVTSSSFSSLSSSSIKPEVKFLGVPKIQPDRPKQPFYKNKDEQFNDSSTCCTLSVSSSSSFDEASFSSSSCSSSSVDGSSNNIHDNPNNNVHHDTNDHNDNNDNKPLRRRPRRQRRYNKTKNSNYNHSDKKSHKTNHHSLHEDDVVLSLQEQEMYIAMDCEMVGVGLHGTKSSVARVTLIGWSGQVLLDTFIQQQEPVTDYRTFVSGITELDLTPPNNNQDGQEQKQEHEQEKGHGRLLTLMTLEECQTLVVQQLQGKILVGHALKNDLKTLQISHPWYKIRDTAKYEPFMQVRFQDDGILWPRKLKDLVKEQLGRNIQVGIHDSYEDALAALDLYRHVRSKWEKVMEYKWNKTRQILQQQQQEQQSESVSIHTETTKIITTTLSNTMQQNQKRLHQEQQERLQQQQQPPQ